MKNANLKRRSEAVTKLRDYISAVHLALSLVFRKAVPWSKERITPSLAWQVAKIVWLEEK